MFPATVRLVSAVLAGWLLLCVAFSQGAAQEADPPDDPEQPSEPGPEDERFRAEIRQALDDCAARLQGRDRKLLELFHIRGLPYRKIAEMLRLSVSAVGVALGRAEQRMRRCLETHHSEIAFLKGLV